MARVRAAFSIAFQLNAFQEHLGSKRRAYAVSTSIISTPLPPCCTSVHDADLPGDSEAPMRPERWRRRTVVASLLREISGLYNAAQLEKGPNAPPRADDHRQLSPQYPVSSHEVTDSLSCSVSAGSGFRTSQFVRMKSNSYPGGAILASRKFGNS